MEIPTSEPKPKPKPSPTKPIIPPRRGLIKIKIFRDFIKPMAKKRGEEHGGNPASPISSIRLALKDLSTTSLLPSVLLPFQRTTIHYAFTQFLQMEIPTSEPKPKPKPSPTKPIIPPRRGLIKIKIFRDFIKPMTKKRGEEHGGNPAYPISHETPSGYNSDCTF